jgi:hypothetical protein
MTIASLLWLSDDRRLVGQLRTYRGSECLPRMPTAQANDHRHCADEQFPDVLGRLRICGRRNCRSKLLRGDRGLADKGGRCRVRMLAVQFDVQTELVLRVGVEDRLLVRNDVIVIQLEQ